jgi:hypothetical protein
MGHRDVMMRGKEGTFRAHLRVLTDYDLSAALKVAGPVNKDTLAYLKRGTMHYTGLGHID